MATSAEVTFTIPTDPADLDTASGDIEAAILAALVSYAPTGLIVTLNRPASEARSSE